MIRIRKKFSKREIILLSIVILVILALGAWYFHFSTVYNQISCLREEKAFLRAEKDRILKIIAKDEQLIENWNESLYYTEHDDKAVPDSDQSYDVLTDLEEIFNSFDGTVHSYRVSSMLELENYSYLELKTQIAGSHDAIIALLCSLESFPYLLLFDSITITAGFDHELVTADLDIRLIFFENIFR